MLSHLSKRQDLMNNIIYPSSLFCVALRAKDTNRIASVGTVMKLLQTEDRSVPNHNKVVVTCQAVGIAHVVSIENPHVWQDDYRGGEYLVANVKVRKDPIKSDCETTTNNDDDNASIVQQLLDNYEAVKKIYSNSQGIASNELPPYARDAISSMPNYTASDIQDEIAFWSFIETWQTLCNTIRQSKLNSLTSMINELSVEAAMELDNGPLQLPVKRHTLPTIVQWKLNEMEQHASRDYMKMGIDPILDFQILIQMTRHWDRVDKVGRMVKNELDRLEAKESLIRAFMDDESAVMGDHGDEVFG